MPEDFTIVFEKGLPMQLTLQTERRSQMPWTSSSGSTPPLAVTARGGSIPSRTDLLNLNHELANARPDMPPRCTHRPRGSRARPGGSGPPGPVCDIQLRQDPKQRVVLLAGREFLEESIVVSQKTVKGQVRCRVYKGSFTVLGRSSETEKLSMRATAPWMRDRRVLAS